MKPVSGSAPSFLPLLIAVTAMALLVSAAWALPF
jgi:hypothetical protein